MGRQARKQATGSASHLEVLQQGGHFAPAGSLRKRRCLAGKAAAVVPEAAEVIVAQVESLLHLIRRHLQRARRWADRQV